MALSPNTLSLGEKVVMAEGLKYEGGEPDRWVPATILQIYNDGARVQLQDGTERWRPFSKLRKEPS